MSNTVYLVCGVPGSGKSWVCEQLTDAFEYVRNDDYFEDEDGRFAAMLALMDSQKPILTDCPFAERVLREHLEYASFTVKPYFIVEPTHIVQTRYRKRTGQQLPQASVTRSMSIIKRADEWGAPRGTSEQVLQMLKTEGAK